jgi:hypothetical protein
MFRNLNKIVCPMIYKDSFDLDFSKITKAIDDD